MTKMWSLCLVLAFASIRNGLAFPQIDEQVGGNAPSEAVRNTFEADGFVFDGPVSEPRSTTNDGTGGSSSDTSTVTGTITRSTTSTPITTTPMPANDLRFDRCVAACLATPEYNPVCGSDSVNYDNPGRLNCAATCGKDVALNHYGRCMTSKIRGG